MSAGSHRAPLSTSGPCCQPSACFDVKGVLRDIHAKRPTLMPGVPTMTEAGYPDIEGENWQAVLVPAGTPREITTLLNREIAAIIALPDMKERLAAVGFEPVASTPDTSAAQIGSEVAKWAKVIRAAGIKVE